MMFGNPIFTFSVISDIQLTYENEKSHKKFIKALHDLHNIDPNTAAMIINGDIVNNGRVESYQKINEILDHHPHPKNVYFTIGNHEFFKNDGNEPSIQRFLEFSKLEKIYYEKIISGYPFIFLGSESWGPVGSKEKDSAVLSTEQLNWLAERAEHYKQIDMPVFVFLHQPMPRTLYGTDLEYYENGVIQAEELKRILSEMKNVFYFSGHTHWDMRFPDMLALRSSIIFVNTGAIYDTWGPDGEGNDTVIDPEGSQGLYIQVYSDRIEIKGRDFTNQQWIQEYQYHFPI